jgi:hypothetical protein
MAIRARLLKGCYLGNEGEEITIEKEEEFNYLRMQGYAALIKYETACNVTPVRRQRGRPKKT